MGLESISWEKAPVIYTMQNKEADRQHSSNKHLECTFAPCTGLWGTWQGTGQTRSRGKQTHKDDFRSRLGL